MDVILWFLKSPFVCLGWIVIGFLAGALARRIMGSSDKSFISDIILGILGAVIGGWIIGFITDLPNGESRLWLPILLWQQQGQPS